MKRTCPRPRGRVAHLLFALALGAAGCGGPESAVGELNQAGVTCDSVADCDDGNPCTNDLCGYGGCAHSYNQNQCRASTGSCDPAEFCSAGACPADVNNCGGGGGGEPATDLNQEPAAPLCDYHLRPSDLSTLAFDDASALPGPTYHGGPLMVSSSGTNIYLIFYGSWTANSTPVQIIQDFVRAIDKSDYLNLLTAYYDNKGRHPTNHVVLKGSRFVASSKYGTTLDRRHARLLVNDAINSQFARDPDGVFFVIPSSDTKIPDSYCSDTCAEHGFFIDGYHNAIKWSFIVNPLSCASGVGCEAQAPPMPNGDTAADTIVDGMAHELAEAITDPRMTAWYGGPKVGELADRCQDHYDDSYFHLSPPYFADLFLGGRHWYVQKLWNLNAGRCAMHP